MTNNEAMRCLLCPRPLCSLKGCPVQTNVPECMRLYREDRLDEAGKILFDNNPLSAITSLVCDWKKFCYGHCVLNARGVPVRWYEIEQEISARYLRSVELEREDDSLFGRRVAIVGAGPAGIAASIWLYRKGADVTLLDSNDRIGGVLRYGIPSFRLERDLVDQYERIILGSGVTFLGGTALGRDVTIDELSESYDAVLLAAGAEVPARLRIPGEDRENVLEALSYLKTPERFPLKGKKVIVIGGGNVAMDSCRTAVREGAETWVFYRKTFENMPANPAEVEEAKADGVQFRVFQAPVEVREGSVIFRDCRNETDPETGRLVTKILDGTDHEVSCDVLIPAISEKPEFKILSGLSYKEDRGWPECGEDGRIVLADGSGSNVFLAGDFILGPKTVVEAVASARKAVEGIEKLIDCRE